MWVTSSIANVLTPNAIALGNFDGIHRGHRQVLQPILNPAGVMDCALPACEQGIKNNPNHIYATVVTFNPHPQEFFTGQQRKLLTPLEEKVQQLKLLGVEQLVLLPFERELACLSPQQFVETVLIQQLQAKRISVGADFRFGHQRKGTATDLKAIAAHFGVDVTITTLQTCLGEPGSDETVRISSSLIRQALEQGEVSQANQMLGRAYTLTGTVVTGQQLGRTIGFPTANLQLPPPKFLPRYGVYCVRVFLEETEQIKGQENKGEKISSEFIQASSFIPHLSIKGIMNLGCRPTVSGETTTVEIHLLDWSGDLYGQTITVSLEQFLRPEQKFPSLEALKTQIAADCRSAREILNSPSPSFPSP